MRMGVGYFIVFVFVFESSSDSRLDNGGDVAHAGEKVKICVGDVCC